LRKPRINGGFAEGHAQAWLEKGGFVILLSLLLSASLAHADSYRVATRGTVTVHHPSFQSLVPGARAGDPPSLLISSFNLLGKDAIYKIADPAAPLRGQTPVIELLTDAIAWPNEARYVDSSVLGAAGLLISSGFLPPNKNTGAVSFLDAGGRLSTLTHEKPGYFYHRAVFADVSRTGRLDILTARAKIPLIGPADGELVWLKRPTSQALDQPWQETVLAKGPDIHFRVAQNPADGSLIIVAAEFSAKQIALYWIDPDGKVRSRVIDNTLGAAFDLEFADLNNDGVKELLVTNHEGQAEKSAVFAYLAPNDYKTGPWTRKTLLSGIETRQLGIGQASPGAAKAFYPEAAKAGEHKPWIVVSGDGSQRVHLLRALSDDQDDWRYRETILLDANSTIGEPMVYDFDGDGLADIVVPAYDDDKLYFLSVKRAD
jgi:hypothetical protein